MVYCKNCGTTMEDSATVCPKCGVRQSDMSSQSSYGGFGWTLLGCVIPILGLILYLIWKESRPGRARALLTGAVISLVAAVLWYFFTAVLGLGSALF